MKYTRTQVGIFEDKFIHIKADNKGNAVMEYKGKYYEPPLSIKQADTIEELCDEFVVIGYGVKGKPAIISCSNGFKGIREMFSNNDVYGAIWTNKGLIYVAKMNDKGELELL